MTAHQPITTPFSFRNFDQWNDAISTTFCPMVCESGNRDILFEGELKACRLDTIGLAGVGSSPLDVYRKKQHIAQISDTRFLVKFQLEGRGLVRQLGREAYLEPGDFVMCSTSEPYALHFPDHYRQAVLSVSQPLLAELVREPESYLGKRMPGAVPTNGLLSQFVFSLIKRIDQLDSSVVRRLEANVLDLLVTSLDAAGRSESGIQESSAQDHLKRIKQFIAMHLGDTRLTPEYIAEAEGISKRYLHMLFKGEDTSISRYIQQKRLEACKRALVDPGLSHLSTTDIAYEWGFSDASHFHRCFKARFNITPRQCRVEAASRH